MVQPRLTALTSLRFLAALFVFFSHLDFLKETHWSFLFIEKGYIGVTFFFILSGFILSYTYQEKKINQRHFYIARFARIYPLHILTFIGALPFVLFVDWGPAYATVTNLLLIQAYVPIQSIYFSGNSPSWSISVEMFFYILFPLLTQLGSRKLIFALIVISTAQVSTSLWQIGSTLEHALVYISPFSRVFDFILGIVLFRWMVRRQHNKHFKLSANTAQISALFTLVLFMYISNIFPIPDVLLFDLYFALPFCLLILAFARNDGHISRNLSYTPLVILGEASFAFYLCHLLIIRYLNSVDQYLFNIPAEAIAVTALLLSILTSIVLYYTFEKPMKRWILSKLLPKQKKTFTNQSSLLQ